MKRPGLTPTREVYVGRCVAMPTNSLTASIAGSVAGSVDQQSDEPLALAIELTN
jgi:hypothetical protein